MSSMRRGCQGIQIAWSHTFSGSPCWVMTSSFFFFRCRKREVVHHASLSSPNQPAFSSSTTKATTTNYSSSRMVVVWSTSITARPGAVLRHSVFFAFAILSLTTTLECASALASASQKSSSSSECSSIPDSLQVPLGFATKELWQQGSMVPLDFSLGQVTAQPEISVSTMLQQHTPSPSTNQAATVAAGAIAFAVRRPG